MSAPVYRPTVVGSLVTIIGDGYTAGRQGIVRHVYPSGAAQIELEVPRWFATNDSELVRVVLPYQAQEFVVEDTP